MRVVALEEHLSFPELTGLIPKKVMSRQTNGPFLELIAKKLANIGKERLKSMDDNGVSVQVLSVQGAGAELLDENDGPGFAKKYNDAIAAKISAFPDRFTAFANLPMTAPEAAADELERTVKEHSFVGALISGLTDDEFLDNPKFAPIFERAEALDVPVYLHPGLPPKAVVDAYYSGLPKNSGLMMSLGGWGWHSETGIHVLRLITSGTFDRFPKLKLIIGHMGEMLPIMMARCDSFFKPNAQGAGANQRSVVETLKAQVHITTSGIFTVPPLMVAIDTFGIDNIMFSVDYPFSNNEDGKAFLESIPLSYGDVSKIAHGNADSLLKLSVIAKKINVINYEEY